MEILIRAVERASRSIGLIGGGVMTGVMIISVANIIARRFLSAPIFGATELVKYGMLIAASLALLNNEWHDGNVQMTIVIENLGKNAKCALGFATNLLGFAGFVYVSYFMGMQTLYKFNTGEVSSDLYIPVWIMVGVLFVGVVLLALCLLIKVFLFGQGLLTGMRIESIRDFADPKAERE